MTQMVAMSGEELARFVESRTHEIVDALIEQFLLEYPDSNSGAMSEGDLKAWSAMEVAEFCRVLRGEGPEIRPHDVYEGDTGQNVDELIQPITTFIEGRLFIARTIANFLWRNLDQPLQAKKAAFGLLDAATLRMMRVNLQSFIDNELPDGCVMRTWDFSLKGTRPRKGFAYGSPREAAAANQAVLTKREEEIALLVAAGRTNGEIASHLGLAQSTVKNRLVRIFDKLGVNTRVELAARMVRDRGV